MRLEFFNVRGLSLPVMKCLIPLLLFLVQVSVAQVYPVQATVQLTPPYSLYLSDYVESGTERLALNVFLADIARPQLDVRFRLKIMGQGISIETKASYIPAPVSLQGGVPLRLISTDLAEYFNPNNLEFSGISRAEYTRKGQLPEGVYQFCFEVLEYNRGIKISNTACGVAWMILNDPPIINLPRQDEKLKTQSPQNVVLQWTPRHTGSPNSAFTTEYDVTMVEVWPASRNPNDAILTSLPIFEVTTGASTVIYGPAETPLEPGRRYAWRVRARSIAGVDQLDLFKNNGYSEVYSFIYGDACDLPTGISTTSTTSTRFSVGWESLFNHTAYRLRYREAGTVNWYDNNTAINAIEIGSLKPGTTYEYQVAPTCGFFDGQYSPVTKVTTEPAPETAYACGVPVDALTLDPTLYTGSLKAGDIIMAGDFDVKLVKVSGANGVYSGEGVIEVPYFNKAKVKTEFSSITVNKDLRMVSGSMNVTGAAVDVIPEGVLDVLDKLDEVMDFADSALTKIEDNLPQPFDPNSFVADTLIDVKNGIADVRKNDDGSVTVYDKSGNAQTIPAGTTAAIKDDSGKGYLVDSKGNIHKTTADVAAKAGNREYKLMLNFSANAQARYGFDKQKYDAITGYEKIEEYKVPWKAVASNGTDVVTAALSGATDLDTRKIRFEQGGVTLTASPIGSGQPTSVTLNGKSDGTEEGLLAVYAATDTSKVQVLGKLNVVTYDEIPHRVVIVPVNNAKYNYNINVLRDSLNRIYGQAVVKWSVDVVNPIAVGLGSSFDDGGTGILSNYTDDMKTVIRAYENDMDDNAFYLFLIGGQSKSGVAGYMPRSKRSGFIFIDQAGTEKQIIRTIAHELGHGAFNLPHTFKEERFPLPEKSTDNLMDYADGQKLYKYQWDKMRYPEIVIGLFEEDEDAQSVIVMNIEKLKGWEYNDVAYAFLAPSGEVVLVPKSVKSLKFSTGDVANSKEENVLKVIPFGSLISFNIAGVTYEAYWTEGSNTFQWYGTKDEKYVYTKFISADRVDKDVDKVIIGIPVFGESVYSYRMQRVSNTFTTLEELKANAYLSAGVFKPYNFLVPSFADVSDVRELTILPSFVDNAAAVDFVRYYKELSKGKYNTPAVDVYLYTHATLLSKYGLLGNCFATGLPGAFLKNIQKFWYTVEKMTLRGDPYTQSISIPFPEDFELNDESIRSFDYLMLKWAEVDINYYKELEKLVNFFSGITISADVTTDFDISTDDLLKWFSEYQELNTDNFDCLFSSLSTSNKRNFLKRLLATKADDLGNKYEKVALKILDNMTSDKEVSEIFKDLKENPEYLYNAYNKMDNLLNSEYIIRFMDGIFRGWKESYLYTGTQYPEFEKFDKEGEEEKAFGIVVDDPTIILLEDEQLFTGTKSDKILESKWDPATWGITISQSKQFLNHYGQMLLSKRSIEILSLLSNDPHPKLLPNLNPLDPVVIFISKQDVKELGIQLQPGIYAVPALLVHWVNTTQKSEVKKFYLRIGLDALAIALAPFTGGGSMALITIEIALPAIDIAMSVTNEQLTSDHETFNTLFEYWDKAYMTYGAAMGVVGLVKSGPAIAGGGRNIMRLVANPKAASRLMRAKLYRNVKAFEGNVEALRDLDVNKFAVKLDELADYAASAVANYAAKWSAYGNELRKLAVNIRLNAELRYLTAYESVEAFFGANKSVVFSKNGVTVELFKCEVRSGVHYATEIRYLRNSDNVSRVAFAGDLGNIRYMDNGKEMVGLFMVEDLDNAGSFFLVTERDICLGIPGVNNMDDIARDYRVFANMDEATFRWRSVLYKIEPDYPKVWASVNGWNEAVLRERFITQLGGNAEMLKYFNTSSKLNTLLGTWRDVAGYENLFTAFGDLNYAQRIKFLDDFSGSGSGVLSGLNSDADLVGVWSEMGGRLSAADAKDIVYLTDLKELKSGYGNIWNKSKVWTEADIHRKFIAQMKTQRDVLLHINQSSKIDEILTTWQQMAVDHQHLFSAFGDLSVAQKISFLDDFAGPARSMLSTFEADATLLNGWRVLDDLGEAALKADLVWLKRIGAWEAEGITFSKTSGVVTLKDPAGVKLAEWKNDGLLPEVYDYDDASSSVLPGGTPVGDVYNGYQIHKRGTTLSVRRVADRSPYNSSEITKLTDHPNAHVLERHGHDVTDDALIKRANTPNGRAPDGSTAFGPPPDASKFETPDQVKKALVNTAPGTPAFASGTVTGNRVVVRHTLTDGTLYGKGVPRGTSSFRTSNKVRAVYENLGGGNYKLLTMFPDF